MTRSEAPETSDTTLVMCREEDLADLFRFIDEQWKRGHLFTVDRRLFDWQHREPDGTYSYVLARRHGAIIGILGFLPTRRFDPALAAANTIWLTMWKVRGDAGDAGLGLRLLRFVTGHEPHVAVGAITTRPDTLPIYARLGYRTGELHHYVLDRGARTSDTEDVALQSASDVPCPYKTSQYLTRRYVNHPVYRYGVHTLADEAGAHGCLVTRVAEHAGLRVMRIVDFVGTPDVLARAGRALRQLLEECNASYADVYNTGIDPIAFAQAGFAQVDPNGSRVVPDHFEPFEARNVRLWFSLKSAVPPILFKGDADQDRPNQVIA